MALVTEIETNFCEFFSNLGFVKWQEEPLIPLEDESLLFTNSTIVPLKKFVVNDTVPNPGVVISQQCLRNQNLKQIFEEEQGLQYMSYFRMLGVLIPSDSIQNLLHVIPDYFTKIENVELTRIVLKYSNTHSFLKTKLDDFQKSGIALACDTMPPKYYSWNYGIPGISGNGATLALLGQDQTAHDIGNIIQITSNDKIVAYEFGFGIETFLSRKLSLDGPFSVSKISACIPHSFHSNHILVRKLQDCISVLVVLAKNKVGPTRGKHGSIFRKTITAVNVLMSEMNISMEQIESFCRTYGSNEFGSNQEKYLDKLLLEIKSHQTRLQERQNKFMHFMKKNKNMPLDILLEEGMTRFCLPKIIAKKLMHTQETA